ncbi:MAG: hypothetical protein ACYDGN_17230 [Acidimicrobiales bacterium]
MSINAHAQCEVVRPELQFNRQARVNVASAVQPDDFASAVVREWSRPTGVSQ